MASREMAVTGNGVTRSPAKELVERHPQRLGLYVPQGHIDRGQGAAQDSTMGKERSARQRLPDVLGAHWILADEQLSPVRDGALNGQLHASEASLANAFYARVGVDHHEHIVAMTAPAGKTVDVADLHCDLHCESYASVRCPRAPCQGRCRRLVIGQASSLE